MKYDIFVLISMLLESVMCAKILAIIAYKSQKETTGNLITALSQRHFRSFYIVVLRSLLNRAHAVCMRNCHKGVANIFDYAFRRTDGVSACQEYPYAMLLDVAKPRGGILV